MTEEKKNEVFEEIYRNYMSEVAELDFAALADRIGVEGTPGGIVVPFFGRPFRITRDGIEGPDGAEPVHAEKVTLCKYLLMYPEERPEEDDSFVSYKDFKDAAPFVGGFKTNAEIPVALDFTGRLDRLREACDALGATTPESELNYDLTARFEALPEVPVVLLFNDEDEEFPALALMLFERRAEKYLDMECLAIIGWRLADYLAAKAGIRGETIM